MTVKLYHPTIKDGAIGRGGCTHEVKDHLVEVCDADAVYLTRRHGLTKPPRPSRTTEVRPPRIVPIRRDDSEEEEE